MIGPNGQEYPVILDEAGRSFIRGQNGDMHLRVVKNHVHTKKGTYKKDYGPQMLRGPKSARVRAERLIWSLYLFVMYLFVMYLFVMYLLGVCIYYP